MPLPKEKLLVNTSWFRDQMAARKLSQRAMAKMLGIDASAVSLMLRGRRMITSEEARKMSDILGARTTEVLRQAGIAVSEDVYKVPVTAAIDEDGVVTLFQNGTHDAVIGPADCPVNTYATQVRAPTAIQDGWVLFVSPTMLEPAKLVDRLCIATSNTGTSRVAVIRRGYRSGTFNLISWPAGRLLQDQTIIWASAILWVKP